MQKSKTFIKWLKFKQYHYGFAASASFRSGVWWHNIRSKNKHKANWRCDSIISLTRHYERNKCIYVYHLTIFGLNMLFSRIKNNN